MANIRASSWLVKSALTTRKGSRWLAQQRKHIVAGDQYLAGRTTADSCLRPDDERFAAAFQNQALVEMSHFLAVRPGGQAGEHRIHDDGRGIARLGEIKPRGRRPPRHVLILSTRLFDPIR